MAKNILIVPSNQVPTPNRIPFINYINSTGGDVLSLKVLLGATITFSSATQGNIFVIDPTNAVISGTTLNVKDYFSVGGVQVLNGTTNWTGSVVGTTISIPSLGYSTLADSVITNKNLLATNPYTQNGLVSNFSNAGYTASFNYTEGSNNLKTALTGSFAKINILWEEQNWITIVEKFNSI